MASPWAYISGPMTGYKNCNREAFENAEVVLRGEGWNVLSPREMDAIGHIDPTREDATRLFARRDLDAIQWLRPGLWDIVVVLPGWRASVGANAEVAVAKWLGIPIVGIHGLNWVAS